MYCPRVTVRVSIRVRVRVRFRVMVKVGLGLVRVRVGLGHDGSLLTPSGLASATRCKTTCHGPSSVSTVIDHLYQARRNPYLWESNLAHCPHCTPTKMAKQDRRTPVLASGCNKGLKWSLSTRTKVSDHGHPPSGDPRQPHNIQALYLGKHSRRPPRVTFTFR